MSKELNNDNSISLNKFISNTGICSRREADKLIKNGKVSINGVVAVLGNRVGETDKVTIDGKPLKKNPKQVYILLNKPRGIVCTTDSKEKNNIVNYINYHLRLFPIGRLDKPSEGLILLTNDGDIVNKILRAGNKHPKKYLVTINKPVTERFIKRMGGGIPILGTVTKKCKVEKVSENQFHITLTQGLNRQIRRMCTYLGCEVTQLIRVKIMHFSITNLKYGEWRVLDTNEVSKLQILLKNSKKTAD